MINPSDEVFCISVRVIYTNAAVKREYELIYMQLQLLFLSEKMRVGKTLIQTLNRQLSSILMQLLFSFVRDVRASLHVNFHYNPSFIFENV